MYKLIKKKKEKETLREMGDERRIRAAGGPRINFKCRSVFHRDRPRLGLRLRNIGILSRNTTDYIIKMLIIVFISPMKTGI